MRRLILSLLAASACLTVACAPPQQKSASPSTRTSTDINRLRTPRPALIRGQAGYEYILNEYLRPQCASCHDQNSFVGMVFASDDPAQAYNDALRYATPNFLNSVSNNKFCGSSCSLSTSGEVYDAIEEWLNNRY
ncbi:MAG TPA: hypothetical protein VFV50_14475 [Bdellovibrionales bacterium]|nr:hypothetical protein [Bdellovibrionales bacterium]